MAKCLIERLQGSAHPINHVRLPIFLSKVGRAIAQLDRASGGVLRVRFHFRIVRLFLSTAAGYFPVLLLTILSSFPLPPIPVSRTGSQRRA